MKFLDKYVKKYWIRFCLAVFCLTIEAACDLMQPTIMSKIIDIGVNGNQIDVVIHMGVIMFIITGIGALGAVGRNIISSNVSQKFATDLRYDVFKKIQTLSFKDIDKYENASLVTRLTNDVTQIQNFANGLMRIFIKSPLLCIGSLIMAIRLNSRMSLIFVVVIPIISVLVIMNIKTGYPFFIKIQKALDRLNGVMREYLVGIRVVKAFNRFDYELVRFEKSNEELSKISSKAMRVMSIFSPGIALVVNLGIVFIIWIGGIRVNNGNMQVGQIIAFINYMTQILFSLMMMSFIFTMFVRAKVSAERIGEVFSEDGCLNIVKNYDDKLHIKGKVEFEKVYFSYYDKLNQCVLKNISFSCMPGETVGIIGSTGSGKSSIVNLIAGFYPIDSGSIKIDNVDINNMDIRNLRDKISIVPQKTTLFSGTIMENIKWGKEKALDEEIKKAALAAEAHEFIKALPEGYDTVLGQGGVNLSGGQKQRVSIARALIKKSEILILDDCTSSLDVITENKIRGNIKKYSKGITCIVITQRINSVMHADKIIVLDNGIITGIGKHKELIKTCDVYKDIFLSQVGREVV